MASLWQRRAHRTSQWRSDFVVSRHTGASTHLPPQGPHEHVQINATNVCTSLCRRCSLWSDKMSDASQIPSIRTQADGGVVNALGAVGGVGVRPAQVQPAVRLRRDSRRAGVVLGQRRQSASDAGRTICMDPATYPQRVVALAGTVRSRFTRHVLGQKGRANAQYITSECPHCCPTRNY